MRRKLVRCSQWRSGFTLIELSVVIAIVAVLVGILVPVLGRSKETSRQAKCGVHLRTLATAVGVYRLDTRDLIPVAESPFNETTGFVESVVRQPYDALADALGNPKDWRTFDAVRCPSDERVGAAIGFGYCYAPSIFFSALSQFAPAERESRIQEVQAAYRRGYYQDLWFDLNRMAHSGVDKTSSRYQVVSEDCSVRTIKLSGIAFEPDEWLRP